MQRGRGHHTQTLGASSLEVVITFYSELDYSTKHGGGMLNSSNATRLEASFS